MKIVSRFEANLLRILHFIVRRAPAEQALPLLTVGCPQPRCLGRAAVVLVQDALAKGCVQILAQDGGWRRARYLRAGRAVEGRLWERTRPEHLGLKFSAQTLAFLVWITATRREEIADDWGWAKEEMTVADWFLLLLAHEALRGSELAERFRKLALFQGNVLCRLMYPQDFPEAPALAPADLRPWTDGPGACILEALQPRLAECWRQVEVSKAAIAEWPAMQTLGQTQERVLVPFLGAVDHAGRLDLARFVLEAAAALLTPEASAALWIGGLAGAGPRLADRAETNRAALAFVRQVPRLRGWHRRARGVGFLDEEYAASQLYKADWEHWQGDELCRRTETLLQQLDPMGPPGGTES
jgi:hypothetical protein